MTPHAKRRDPRNIFLYLLKISNFKTPNSAFQKFLAKGWFASLSKNVVHHFTTLYFYFEWIIPHMNFKLIWLRHCQCSGVWNRVDSSLRWHFPFFLVSVFCHRVANFLKMNYEWMFPSKCWVTIILHCTTRVKSKQLHLSMNVTRGAINKGYNYTNDESADVTMSFYSFYSFTRHFGSL